MTKRLSVIVIALAMLIALTGIVVADCAPGQGVPAFDGNLGSVSDNVDSHLLVQCDGFLTTQYTYLGQSSNGRMKAPMATNQTMFQTGYAEDTFAANGLTMYSNNVTTTFPTVAGDINTISTDRNILFESTNGVIMTDESVFTSVYGNFPMNGSKEAGIEGGSMITNHAAGYSTDISASNLALSSQNNVVSGTVDRTSPVIGAYPDLVNIDSVFAAQGNTFGIGNIHSFAFDQTGSAFTDNDEVTNVPLAEHTFSNDVTFNGNFAVNHDFHWALKSVPNTQTLHPTGAVCMF